MSELPAISTLLQDYFDGLHFGDTGVLARVFHPQAMYACATEGTLRQLDMAAYFPIVQQRASPHSQGQARHDQVISIEMAGPVTAMARVQCAIGPKYFTDLLSLVKLEGRWQILAKVFHFDLRS